jgi:hypothetical protein
MVKACFQCDKRWLEGSSSYIEISMCQECIDKFVIDPACRDEFGMYQCAEIIYSKLKHKRTTPIVRPAKQYLLRRQRERSKTAKNSPSKSRNKREKANDVQSAGCI